MQQPAFSLIVVDAYDFERQFVLSSTLPLTDTSSTRYWIRLDPAVVTAATSVEIGQGDARIVFDGDYMYRRHALSFVTGAGDDHLTIGAGDVSYVGSINVDTGAGADSIVLSKLQGNTAGAGMVRAGEGNDRIEVLATLGSVGIFSNSPFQLLAEAGDDLFVLQGTQLNISGTATIAKVDGGEGFDTLQWNARYQLSLDGHQVAGVDKFPGTNFAQEVQANSIERLDLSPTTRLVTLRFTAADVRQITSGSDFDRSTLGLAEANGIGDVLFVDGQRPDTRFDLGGWSTLGPLIRDGRTYDAYIDDGAILAIEMRDGGTAGTGLAVFQPVFVDAMNGARLRLDDYLGIGASVTALALRLDDGSTPEFAVWDRLTGSIRVSGGRLPADPFNLHIDATLASGGRVQSGAVLEPIDLHFRLVTAADIQPDGSAGQVERVSSPSPGTEPAPPAGHYMAAIGDINGDDRADVMGGLQNVDGSFSFVSSTTSGLVTLFADGRVHRDNRLVDLDNDGDLDLVANTYSSSIPGAGRALLFANDGKGRFEQMSSFSAMAIQGYGETIVAADFDNNGYNDLYLPYYFRADPLIDGGGEVAGSRLLLNNGALDFSDATDSWLVDSPWGGSLSLKDFGPWTSWMPEGAQAVDFNRDGWVDIYVNSHLFLNQSGSFVDVGAQLGVPGIFDEGAVMFDWNNDGNLDLLLCPPDQGPVLLQFDRVSQRFERVEVFPNLFYQDAYGINVGDVNGDGWDDIFVSGGATQSPRLLTNQAGQRFVEYRSATTDGLDAVAAPALDDIDGDGRVDLVFGGSPARLLINESSRPVSSVAITLLGSQGQRNQYGHLVQLHPLDGRDNLVLTRVVDGGSGYMAQRDYRLLFTDERTARYRAEAFVVEGDGRVSVRLDFEVQSGHQYEVRTGESSQAARVIDLSSGQSVPYTRTYAATIGEDQFVIDVPGSPASAALGQGNDRVVLHAQSLNSQAGSTLLGGDGDDMLELQGSNAYTSALVGLDGGSGNDILRAGTATGQFVGALHVDGGGGDDLIEIGHVEGSRSPDSGVYGGDGNDTIRVFATLADVGIFGNGAFTLSGGAGNDVFDLQGMQFNLRGENINMVDGGSGFDTLVWNARYDLNRNTQQTSADTDGLPYAAEIGVRNIEHLDIASSGGVGRTVSLDATEIAAITADSDFDRASLAGLGLSGSGNLLFVDLGSNTLRWRDTWEFLGPLAFDGVNYDVLRHDGGALLLFSGGSANGTWSVEAEGGSITWYAAGASTGIGSTGDDVLMLHAQSLNSQAGSTLLGGDGDDMLELQGSNAYTSALVGLDGGSGNDILRAGTATGQFVGALHVDGGGGDDLIEIGHVEGSRSPDSGVYGGDGNDTIRVFATLADVGIFGNGAFTLSGGAGNDVFDLQGMQFNLRGENINMVDGGSGFDTLVWNARYDLNRNTQQTSADTDGLPYAAEIGVRNIEHLDIASSGGVGRTVSLDATEIAAITADSDFDRASLAGLGLSGSGNLLFVDLGSNTLRWRDTWEFLGPLAFDGVNYDVLRHDGGALLLFSGGSANGTWSVEAEGGSITWYAAGASTGIGSTGDDVLMLHAQSLNSQAGSTLLGGDGDDMLELQGSNAYTSALVGLDGGSGNDILRAGTATGQFVGALHVDGGGGDDLIEIGHVEGSRSPDSGVYGGDGNDTIRVFATLADVGIFGNGAFTLSGGAGNDVFDLQGMQFNLRGENINMVDGGSGFDTLVWNARYDLNRNTQQTSADTDGLPYAAEIGVRNIEHLDIASSGGVGRTVSLDATEIAAITADSDFDRASLAALNLTGQGHVLFIDLGDPSNALNLVGRWNTLGDLDHEGLVYAAYQQDQEVALVRGGQTTHESPTMRQLGSLLAEIFGTGESEAHLLETLAAPVEQSSGPLPHDPWKDPFSGWTLDPPIG